MKVCEGVGCVNYVCVVCEDMKVCVKVCCVSVCEGVWCFCV